MLKTRAGDIVGNVPFDERLVRMKEVRALTGLGRSTIHRLIREGRFPKNFHLFGNPKLAAWKYSDIARWIADRCWEAA